MLKKQCVEFEVSKMETLPSKGTIESLWVSQIHKDSIHFLNVISLEKKYACTLCIDGYFKLVELGEE